MIKTPSAALIFDKQMDCIRVMLVAYHGITDEPLLNPTQTGLDVQLERMDSLGAGLECNLDSFRVSHEFGYRMLDVSEDYGWGNLELSKTFILPDQIRTASATLFWSYITEQLDVQGYDTLRKEAIGLRGQVYLTIDNTLSFAQEVSAGTHSSDIFLKSALSKQVFSGTTVDIFIQYSDVEFVPDEEVTIVGIEYVQRSF